MLSERDTKRAINEVLGKYKPAVYWYMPVPTGYGRSTLDYLGVVRGHGFAVEAKAPGKKPKPRQNMIIDEIRAAGGKVFVIDSPYSPELEELNDWLRMQVERPPLMRAVF
jgi:hypothetical protein